MSWYLANEEKIIDQFASGQGLSDLRREIEAHSFPALQSFIDEGATENILPCIDELNQLVQKTRDEDVKVTALGLAKLMRGQTLVLITQGVEDEDDSLQHPQSAKPVKPTVRKAKKKAAPKKEPIARKPRKKATPEKGSPSSSGG